MITINQKKEILKKFRDEGFTIVPIEDGKPVVKDFYKNPLPWSRVKKYLQINEIGFAIALDNVCANDVVILDIDTKEDKTIREIEDIIGPIRKHLAFAPNRETNRGYHIFFKVPGASAYKNISSKECEVLIRKHLVNIDFNKIIKKRWKIQKLEHEKFIRLYKWVEKRLARIEKRANHEQMHELAQNRLLDTFKAGLRPDHTTMHELAQNRLLDIFGESAYESEFCPYFKELLEEENWGHVERISIAALLLRLKKTKKEIHALFKKACSDYNYQKTEYHLNWLKRNNYMPYNCENLMCPYQDVCKCKNPVNFASISYIDHSSLKDKCHFSDDFDISLLLHRINTDEYCFLDETPLSNYSSQDKRHLNILMYREGSKKDFSLEKLNEWFREFIDYRINFRLYLESKGDFDTKKLKRVVNLDRIASMDQWDFTRKQNIHHFEQQLLSGNYFFTVIYRCEKLERGKDSIVSFLKRCSDEDLKLYRSLSQRGESFFLRYPYVLDNDVYYLGVIVFFGKKPKLYKSAKKYIVEEFDLRDPNIFCYPIVVKLLHGWWNLKISWFTVFCYWLMKWRLITCSSSLKLPLPIKFKNKKGSADYTVAGYFDRETLADYLEIKYGIDREIGLLAWNMDEIVLERHVSFDRGYNVWWTLKIIA